MNARQHAHSDVAAPAAGPAGLVAPPRVHHLWCTVLLALGCFTANGRADGPTATVGATYLGGEGRPAISHWLPSRGRECNGRGKYRRFCQGPRKVPAPSGDAAELATRLGLGTDRALRHLILRAPKPAWVAAAGGEPGATDGSERKPAPLLWPVPNGKQWRGFGWNKGKRGGGFKQTRRHKGVDIGAPQGSPIHAARGGLVAYANNGIRGYGNLLAIIHPDGTVALYAHCKAIYVFPGQRVERGRRVADVGHTGIARGSHLHFEYRRRGRPRKPAFVDPSDGTPGS